jgi:redox-sensitive bicupin YhaK (pirin superfamily)
MASSSVDLPVPFSPTRKPPHARTHHQDARLYAGLFDGPENAALELAAGRLIYVHLARGRLEANGVALQAGDALRVTEGGVLSLDRGQAAEVLVFDLPAA